MAERSDNRENTGSVGLVGAIAIGIGGMVGGGIFAVLGVAAELAGGATPVSFLVGGSVAALTAYSYSRLSVRFRSNGGTVVFVDRVFGAGELTGSLNIVLWVGYIATTALYAAAFGNYAATLFPGGTDPDALLLRGLVLVGVAVPWLINLTNAGLVARSETYVVAMKLAILLLVIAAGVPAVESQRLEPTGWPPLLSVVAAGMLIFVAYEGFELIANASAEVKRPKVTLPRAFALSVGIVIVLYVAISAVVVGSLSADEIAASADFALAEAASASLGQVGFTLVAVSAVLATFSAINATLYGAARLSYTIATEGELPIELERRTWNQPVGLHITAAVGLTIAVALPLASISGISSAIFLMVFAVVNAAAYRAAGGWGVARVVAALGIVGCLGSLATLVGRSITEDVAAVVGLMALLVGALLTEHFFLKRRRPARLATGG
jgi:amino acid transporter